MNTASQKKRSANLASIITSLPVSVICMTLHLTVTAAPETNIPATITNPVYTAASPSIVEITPTGCVTTGQWLTLTGKHFSTRDDKGIALGGNGIHVDLEPRGWNNTQIKFTLPDDARILPGKVYYIGIESANHRQWLSNIGKTVTVCSKQVSAPPASPVSMAPPGRKIIPTEKTIAPGRGMAPGVSATPRAGAGETAGSGTTAEADAVHGDEGYEEYVPSAPSFPASGGSLLGRGLPAVPQMHESPSDVAGTDRFEPGEIMAVTAGMEEATALAQQLVAHGITVKRRQPLKHLGLVISILRIPPEYDVVSAVDSLRSAYPDLWTDLNHRYSLNGDESSRKSTVDSSAAGTTCGPGAGVGMVDTGIDAAHPALGSQQINTHSFLSPGITPAPADHGTAIAGLLSGSPGHSGYSGLLPVAQLHAAEVFRLRDDKHVETTAELIVRALDWLAGQHVCAIVLDPGGPRNLVIEIVQRRLTEKNIAVIAVTR